MAEEFIVWYANEIVLICGILFLSSSRLRQSCDMEVSESDEEHLSHMEMDCWVTAPRPPACMKVWVMMHMPMKSIYSDLESSVTSVSGLLDSIINTCTGYKDVFIPNRKDQQSAEQYTAFTTWLLGRLFYLMSSSVMSSKMDLCTTAQVSILRLLERHRYSVFICVVNEYLKCLEDIARVQDVQVKLEAPFVLKRFVPVSNDVLEEQLDLSQFQVVISNSMDMCVRFQAAVLQILSSVLSSVMEYDRSVYNKLWVVLCDTLAVAPLTVKALVFELAARVLRKAGFTMDVKIQNIFCQQLKSTLSAAMDVFTSQEFPEEERIKLAHTLKGLIDVITDLNGTEADGLDEMLFSAMKLVVVKWKPSIPTDEVVQAAATLALTLLKKLPNVCMEQHLIGELVSNGRLNPNVVKLLQWCVYEDMVTFLSSLDTVQESALIECESELVGRGKAVKEGGVDGKAVEENKIQEENEVFEEEKDGGDDDDYDDYDDDDGDDDDDDGEWDEEEEEDDENDDGEEEKVGSAAEECEGGMEFIQDRRIEEAKTSACDNSCSQSSTNMGPKIEGAQKVKVFCADGSSTWRKLLDEFNVLLDSVKNTNESSQMVQLLECMHSIIRCATEVIVELETNNSCPVGETPFIFTFFGDCFGDMIRVLIEVLSALSCEEDGADCVILMCLDMVGSVLHMPESHNALPQDIKAAITLLSLPWHKQVPPVSDMDHALLPLLSQFTSLSRTEFKMLSLKYLLHILHSEYLDWRFSLMKHCIQSEQTDFACSVVCSIPFILQTKQFSPGTVFSDILQPTLAIGETHVPVQHSLASIVGDLTCVLAGSCVCLRKVERSQRKYEVLCVECHPDKKLYRASECNYLQQMENQVLRFLQLLHSPDENVRLLMVRTLKQLSTHISSFHQPDVQQCWLHFLRDENMSVRTSFAFHAKYLVFNPKWIEEKQSESETLLDEHIPLSQKDKRQLTQSIPLLSYCVEEITKVVYDSLATGDRGLQHTIIFAVRSLGTVPLDCVLLPTLANLLVFIAHPSSLVLPVAKLSVGEIAEAHNVRPYDIYIRFKKEICNLIVSFVVLNHHIGGLSFGTSVQRMVRALGFTSFREFLQKDSHHIIPYLVPAIVKNPGTSQLLNDIGKTVMVDTKTLIEETFQHVYPHIYLYENEETLTACIKYMEDFTGVRVKHLKKRSFKVIHNELLLHYECQKERVLDALRDLAKDDPDYEVPDHRMSLGQIADYLQPRFLGVLVFFDSKLVTRKVAESVKKKALSSLPEIIRLMGPKHITPVRFKVLATLRTALKLNYSNFPDLNVAAWDAFVHSVEVIHLGPLLSTIFVSLLPLLGDFTVEIGRIFSFLIIENNEVLQHFFKELYFVEPNEAIVDIYNEIQAVINENGPPTFMDRLAIITSSISHDNVDVELYGLQHLSSLLRTEKDLFQACIGDKDHVDPIIREIMDALLMGCRDEDENIRLACADCIGAIGAVDPGHLSWREIQREKEDLPLGADADQFAVLALNHLARSFQQCRDTQTMDAFSLAMQELLKLFKISPDEKSQRKRIWDLFPRDVQEIMAPLLSSYYKNSIGQNVQMPHPIIGSKYGLMLSDWACNWTFTVLESVTDPFIQAVFEACTISLKRDLQTLLFFMPYILLHAVRSASPVNLNCFLEEMMAVIDISSRVPHSSPDDARPSFAVPVSGSGTVSVEGLTVDTRTMCAKTVFTLIDFLWRFMREWISAHYLTSTQIDDPVYNTVKAFVSKLSALKIAESNFECGEYTRALMYLEMFIKDNPQQFQEQLWLFMEFSTVHSTLVNFMQVFDELSKQSQDGTLKLYKTPHVSGILFAHHQEFSTVHLALKIYARLNEPDAVHGIMATRGQEPSLEELIIAHEVTGQLQDAVACYERMAQDERKGPDFYTGMVQCYLGLDQPVTALRIAQGIVSERPEMAAVMQEFEAEAFWRLQMFDELGSLLSSADIAENKSWGVQTGRALLHFQAGRSSLLYKHLTCMRKELVDGLGTVSLEKGSYQEEFQNIIRLHILNEVERAEQTLQAMLKGVSNEQHCMSLAEQLMEDWEVRLKNVEQFSRTKEPILSMRRTVLVLAKSLIEEKLPAVAKYLDKEVGKCWLQSAVTARKDGLYQQAYTYMLNAEKYHLKELFVEKAKLYWEKGEQDPAFFTLRRGLEEHFPNVETPDSSSTTARRDDTKICAEAKLLLATYNDETVNVDMDVNICNYKQAVDACRQWEKSSVCLAQYYDRVLGVMAEEERNTRGGDVQVNMVNFYGKSLRYGCSYIYQSMPRMLSLWLDFGTSLAEMEKDRDRTRGKLEIMANMKKNLDKMTKIIDQLIEELPPYMFLTAFSQLVSRICHPHTDVFRHLKTIIVYMLLVYPQQSLWMLMPVYKSSSAFRVRRCEEVLNDPVFRNTMNMKLLSDFTRLTEKLIELTEKPIGGDVRNVTVSSLVGSLPRLLKAPEFSDIMMPCQQFTVIQLPADDNRLFGHNPFPLKQVYIKDICDELVVLPSLQKPRRISFVGSDGNRYMMMCKAKDDLRKDFRFMEFNNVVNRYLRKDPESRQRGLYIRTYHVVPLNEECGIVEWVPKLLAYRNILIRLYKEAGIYTNNKQLKEMSCNLTDSHSTKRENFEQKLLPRHPPVFDEWFRFTFPEPYAWYRARTSYIRTTAVMSMVGYMLGLGDRHGENILFDTVSGETVHVDFNCIFNKGESFAWPERVPFRLTHNMVAAMGPLGVEGMFRRSCEVTLRVLRAQSETLMSVLRPFVYDPMVTWRSTSARPPARKESVETTNELAVKNLEDIEGRFQGMMRVKGNQHSSMALSVEGQANNLIQEATSIDNLCEMYIGWGPFM